MQKVLEVKFSYDKDELDYFYQFEIEFEDQYISIVFRNRFIYKVITRNKLENISHNNFVEVNDLIGIIEGMLNPIVNYCQRNFYIEEE